MSNHTRLDQEGTSYPAASHPEMVILAAKDGTSTEGWKDDSFINFQFAAG